MARPKIHLLDKSISFEMFSEKFGEHFIISDPAKKKLAIEEGYEKATGRKAIAVKTIKKDETTGSKSNSGKVEGNDTGSNAKASPGEHSSK